MKKLLRNLGINQNKIHNSQKNRERVVHLFLRLYIYYLTKQPSDFYNGDYRNTNEEVFHLH
jgi:hypothetical protein